MRGQEEPGPPARQTPVEVEHLPTHWSPTLPRPKRPIGVALIAIVLAIAGLLVLISGLLSLVDTLLGSTILGSLVLFPAGDVLGSGILVLVGAVTVAVANALWDQERWALWTAIIGTFLTTTYLFFTESLTVLFLIVLVLFVYLITVRRYFY